MKIQMRGYGVPKGSKKPKVREFVRNPDRLSTEEAQEAYDKLDENRKRVMRAAARYIHVRGVTTDDVIPQELIDMRSKIKDITLKMQRLLDSYPKVLK